MTRHIADLQGWPIGVWISAEGGQPNYAEARITEAVSRGRSIRLEVSDKGRQFSSSLTASSSEEAERAAELLQANVGSILDAVQWLEVGE